MLNNNCDVMRLLGDNEESELLGAATSSKRLFGGGGRVNNISKKYLWIYGNIFIPFYYIRVNTNKILSRSEQI